jgi:hypothetical protein
MKIPAFVEALRADLEALGALGDEATAGIARRLATAMEAPITARLLEALGQVAAELQSTLPAGRVEVRLIGSDAEMVLVGESPVVENDDAGDADDGDASARITLRLSPQLKARIEAASAREGVSVNSFIVRALGRQSRPERAAKGGRRLSGYGRS